MITTMTSCWYHAKLNSNCTYFDLDDLEICTKEYKTHSSGTNDSNDETNVLASLMPSPLYTKNEKGLGMTQTNTHISFVAVVCATAVRNVIIVLYFQSKCCPYFQHKIPFKQTVPLFHFVRLTPVGHITGKLTIPESISADSLGKEVGYKGGAGPSLFLHTEQSW